MKVKDQFVSQEKSVGLIRKWAVLMLGTVFLWLLYPDRFLGFNQGLFIFFAGIYVLYTIYVLFLAKGILFNILWHLIYFIELVFVSFLIFYTDGMDSILILFYPVILIGNALVRNSLKDFIFAGILGHISYAFTLLVYYSSLKFYLDPDFWVQCFILGSIFALGLMVVRYLLGRDIMIGKLSDEIEQKEHKIEDVSIIDELTGLYKSGYFLQRLTEEVNRSERYATNLSLLLLDIDYFKNYNEIQGQPMGDVALQQIARILFRLTRETDICCRWKEGKMAVILPHTDLNGGIRLAERIRKEVEEQQFRGEEHQPEGILTVSIGVGNYPANAKRPEDLLEVTETALQMAKEEKKNKTRPYLSLIVGSKEKASS